MRTVFCPNPLHLDTNQPDDARAVLCPKDAVTTGGHLVWLSAEVAGKHLSSRAFLSAARRETAAAVAAAEGAAAAGDADNAADPSSDDDAEDRVAGAEAAAALVAARLQEGYASLAECALTLLQAGVVSADPTTPPPKAARERKAAADTAAAAAPLQMLPVPADAKSAARMERGGRQVLAALDGLLAPGPYLRALAPLLAHADGRVRRKALRLIAHRLHAAAAAAAAPTNKFGKKKGEKARDARSRARAKGGRSWQQPGGFGAAPSTKKKEAGADPREDSKDVGDEEATEEEEEWREEVAAGVALIGMLAGLAGHGGGSSRQAALSALEAAAARFAGAPAAVAPVLAAAPAAVNALSATSRTVVAAAAACLAAIISALGPRSVPVLPSAVPALFATANAAAASLADAKDAAAAAAAAAAETEDEAEAAAAAATASARDDEGHVLVASLRAVDVLMEQLSGFLSPYLPDLLRLLLSPALVPAAGAGVAAARLQTAEAAAGSAAAVAAESAVALRDALPRALPMRLLLRPLSDAYDAALALGGARGAAAAAAGLQLAAASAAAAPPPPAHRAALVTMLLRALDVRRTPPAGGCPASAVDAVEAAAVDAFVTVSLQLTETSFVPVFTQVVEWAKARAADAPAARTRLAALFRLSGALADALRAVFVPLATPLLDLAAAALDPVSDPTPAGSGPAKKRRKSGGMGGEGDTAARVAEADTWRMRTNALSALRRLFVHDAGDFLDAGRFNQLHPLITRQITATPPPAAAGEDVLAEAEDGAHLTDGGLGAEAVACVAALIAAAPDDALWKPAHRGVLLATRDAAPRSRLIAIAALSAVVDRLQEEYLALLPEAIPFLSELFEDPDEAVEGAARSLTARLTEMSGEDLKSLMAEGGGA
jgi:U3 small nucleolar RNA-associated protein 10